MPVVTEEDIELRLSTTEGSAGDSQAGTPEGSLGKYISTTPVVSESLSNVFTPVPLEVALPGGDVYRCVFVVNNAAAGTWNGRVWITSQKDGGGVASIGLDPAGVVPGDDTDPQAEEIADQQTAPDGVEFSAPSNWDDALEIGVVEPGECAAVWIRVRYPEEPPAMALDEVKLMISGLSDVA